MKKNKWFVRQQPLSSHTWSKPIGMSLLWRNKLNWTKYELCMYDIHTLVHTMNQSPHPYPQATLFIQYWQFDSCPERFIGYTISVLACIDNQVLPDNTIGFLSLALWWPWRLNNYWLSTVLNPVLTYPIIPNPYWSTGPGW